MDLPGPKRLTFCMRKEIADANRDDLLVLLEGEPLPAPDLAGIVQFDFVGRDISFAPVVGRVLATPGVSVIPVF
jgi:hypothetical protein